MTHESLQENPYLEKSFAFDEKLLEIPVRESGELMVPVLDVVRDVGAKIELSSGGGKEPRIYFLRQSVAESFANAALSANNAGFILKLEHAYRSLEIQRGKFIQRVVETKTEYPTIPEYDALKAANVYTAGIPVLAAHLAGAAVDVQLLDSQGNSLPLGPEYPSGVKEVTTDYPFLPDEVKKNRQILMDLMQDQRFVNYPFEYWHFSQGDVCAAYILGEAEAIYSPIEFNPQTGTVGFLPEESYRSFFEIE